MSATGQLLRATALVALLLAFAVGCQAAAAGQSAGVFGGLEEGPVTLADEAPPTPAPTPAPVVLPPGIERRMLMEGTPYETPLYLIGTGEPGPVVLVLGGVHGDEPGGWLAAERVLNMEFARGSLLVVPRANRQAILVGQRTTEALGDLNRLYPGDPEGLPMARMAFEITQLVREFRVDVVLDLHESWAFYEDRPENPANGRAFLGQTIIAYPNEVGPPLAQAIIDAVNGRILYPRERLFYRQFPSPSSLDAGIPPQTPITASPSTGGRLRASLRLGYDFPNVASLTVEMAQLQPLERRIALHLAVVEEALRLLGMRE